MCRSPNRISRVQTNEGVRRAKSGVGSAAPTSKRQKSSIMMFNICTGHGVAPVPKQDILILVSTLHHVAAAGVRFIFTNQHAYPEMAEYFTRMENLNRIDWSLLQSRDFRHDSEDPAKKERYQAGALLWKHVPLSAIQGVCCFDQQVLGDIQHQIQQRGIDFKAAAQPQWYF